MLDQIQSEVIFHEVIDSTNVEAKRLIENDKINKATWIIANRQTSGKGRNNNKWVSEVGNFYGSYVLPINLDHRKIPFISCITSLSVYDAIKNFLPNNALLKIKWPNDILYNDAKLAGILIENLLSESASFSIIGVGINLKNSPNINNYKTISIKSIIENEVMPKDILGTLDTNINNYLNILNSDNISELIESYKNNCWKMRDRVRFLQNNIEFEGILDDITDTFEILIKVNGELKKFNSGELSFSY